MHRTLVESEDFTNKLQEIGNLERLDDALTGVYWALSTKPEVYDPVHRDIRVLKTDPLCELPALSIRFRIREGTVELLHVEPTGDGIC